jgi:ATP-dependent Clp protease ATP-binding subunit ClpB
VQVEKTDLDKKLHDQITKRRRLRELRANNAALLAHNTDVSKVDHDITTTNTMIKKLRDLLRDKDDALAKINLSALRDHVVTPEHVSETFSELSDIPTDQLNEDERERVLHMEDILGERVFGQPKALHVVANAIRRERAKLTEDETTPKGSFLFLGPSGVGKTETGKALAWFLTGTDKNLIRIDMSEFMEKHSVSRLIGAPPGYAGYDEGGVLTNAVLAKPKSVVMFDEAEKAHVDVFKPLLSVTSDGRLTDGQGVTVDFRETMIILTSNAGSRHFLNDQLTFEQAEQMAMQDVKNWLPTEFIGRLDGIVCFHRLEMPMLKRVAKRRVEQLNRGISKNQLRLEFPDPDVETFCTFYQNPDYGARPILQAMKSTLEGDLAIAILERKNGAGVFTAHYVSDKLAVDFEPAHA